MPSNDSTWENNLRMYVFDGVESYLEILGGVFGGGNVDLRKGGWNVADTWEQSKPVNPGKQTHVFALEHVYWKDKK